MLKKQEKWKTKVMVFRKLENTISILEKERRSIFGKKAEILDKAFDFGGILWYTVRVVYKSGGVYEGFAYRRCRLYRIAHCN